MISNQLHNRSCDTRLIAAVVSRSVICFYFDDTKLSSVFSSFILVMIASEEEMISAKIPLDERDYCAHKKIEYLMCRADVWPWAYKCHHSKHALDTCMFEE